MSPNNSFNDILPPQNNNNSNGGRRSIRDIPISERKQNKIDELLKETADIRAEHPKRPEPRPEPIPRTIEQEERSRLLWWIFLICIGVVILTIAALILFGKAHVNITLQTKSIPVEVMTVSVANASSTAQVLPYKVIPVHKEGNREVAATGVATKVEKKASGTIIVYNNYSTESQQLVATTRFESPQGLVYRIDKPITIPGTTVSNGQTVPGSVEAVVYADQPGEKYNSAKTDFTVPGFKGSDKYEKFYARSKTALTGGFSGSMPKVSDTDLKTANQDLEQSLIAQIETEIKNQLPAGYVFFKQGIRTNYSSTVGPSSDGKAQVTGKVEAEGIIFEQNAVEKIIAENNSGMQYHFDNLDSLTLSIENKEKVNSFISNPALSIRLSGTLTTGQSFDQVAVKRVISGKAKVQLKEILKLYPEIVKADAVIRPFWSRSFPKNPEKIEIIINK